MNKLAINDLKVGDLVKLRDDLELRKAYGDCHFKEKMKFKGFKKIGYISKGIGTFTIEGMDAGFIEYYYTPEMIAEVKKPTKYKTIYKRPIPILDDVERRCLRGVIRPFRDRVAFIKKIYIDGYHYYIAIGINGESPVSLPTFMFDAMYKGMDSNRLYNLEELDL